METLIDVVVFVVGFFVGYFGAAFVYDLYHKYRGKK